MLIESCQLITGSIVSVQSSDASDGSRNDQPVTGGMWRVRWQGGGHTTQLQVRFNSYFDEYYSNKAHQIVAHRSTYCQPLQTIDFIVSLKQQPAKSSLK